jgi:hypothetical protein
MNSGRGSSQENVLKSNEIEQQSGSTPVDSLSSICSRKETSTIVSDEVLDGSEGSKTVHSLRSVSPTSLHKVEVGKTIHPSRESSSKKVDKEPSLMEMAYATESPSSCSSRDSSRSNNLSLPSSSQSFSFRNNNKHCSRSPAQKTQQTLLVLCPRAVNPSGLRTSSPTDNMLRRNGGMDKKPHNSSDNQMITLGSFKMDKNMFEYGDTSNVSKALDHLNAAGEE